MKIWKKCANLMFEKKGKKEAKMLPLVIERIIIMNKYTVIDIETTGLYANKGDEITEIAGINVVDGEVITSYSTLVNIKGEINDFIKNLTGITKEMCNNSVYLDNVFHTFMDALDIDEDTNLVIFNVEFDYSFIAYWINGYNIDKDYKDRFLNCNKICALELARKVLPGWSHKLDNLKEKFGIKSKSHRALNDCLVTNKVYQKLLELEGKQCQ